MASFVSMLIPIGQSIDRMNRAERAASALEDKNTLAQQRADTAKLNAENRKRELDIIENGVRQSNLNAIQQGYQGVHLQMNPVHEPNREYIGTNPSFEQVDGRTIIGNYAY